MYWIGLRKVLKLSASLKKNMGGQIALPIFITQSWTPQ